MKIIRSYILKQLIAPFIGTFLILTLVLVVGNITKLTDLIINKGVNIFLIFQLFALQIPSLLCYTLPLSILFSILLVFGRLAHDNEIIIMRSSGINLFHITTFLITLGLIISLSSVIINDKVLSKSRYLSRIITKKIGITNPAAFLEEGVFVTLFEKFIVYVHSIKGNKLEQIRIYSPQDNAPTRTIIAESGEFEFDQINNNLQILLSNGTSEEPDKSDPGKFYKLNFKKYSMTINLGDKFDKHKVAKKPKDMSLKELTKKIKTLSQVNESPRPFVTEFHKKISLAFAPLVFILCGLPLALITKRNEKTIIFIFCVIIATIYYLLLITSESLTLTGIPYPSLIMWLPNIILGMIGISLTWKVQRI